MKIENKWLIKLLYQIISLKLWILAATITLLSLHLLGESTFLAVVGLVLLGREGVRIIEMLKGK